MHPVESPPSSNDPVESGAYWMGHGIDLSMKGDFQAQGRLFEVVD